MFDDLITAHPPAPNRARHCDGDHELHLYEGAVMLAFAAYLLRSEGMTAVSIHPDGEHGKQFDFQRWLAARGFHLTSRIGTTAYGGVYGDSAGRTITVNPKSGVGDVVAEGDGRRIVAECKGGIINTRHPGQKSRLDRGLCEVVGRLMATPVGDHQFAVAPDTPVTRRVGGRLAPRCALAGISIALVQSTGTVEIIADQGHVSLGS